MIFLYMKITYNPFGLLFKWKIFWSKKDERFPMTTKAIIFHICLCFHLTGHRTMVNFVTQLGLNWFRCWMWMRMKNESNLDELFYNTAYEVCEIVAELFNVGANHAVFLLFWRFKLVDFVLNLMRRFNKARKMWKRVVTPRIATQLSLVGGKARNKN